MGITKSEILLAELNTFFQRVNPKNIFSSIYAYYRTYENYKDVLLNIARGKYPFRAKLRNGRSVEISNHLIAYFYTVYFNKYQDVKLDNFTLEFTFYGKKLRFYGWKKGNVEEIFVFNEYDALDIKDRIVIDVGASIADSTVYFALKGAKKVIAFEPFPKIFSIAEKNIKENNVESKVTLVNAGCGYDGKVNINTDLETDASASLIDQKYGIEIPVYSLDSIVSKYNIEEGSILKADCEGCEYPLILQSSKDSISKFYQIIIEYHYGYKPIVERLRELNFKVKYTLPKVVVISSNLKYINGKIFAISNYIYK